MPTPSNYSYVLRSVLLIADRNRKWWWHRHTLETRASNFATKRRRNTFFAHTASPPIVCLRSLSMRCRCPIFCMHMLLLWPEALWSLVAIFSFRAIRSCDSFQLEELFAFTFHLWIQQNTHIASGPIKICVFCVYISRQRRQKHLPHKMRIEEASPKWP